MGSIYFATVAGLKLEFGKPSPKWCGHRHEEIIQAAKCGKNKELPIVMNDLAEIIGGVEELIKKHKEQP